MTRLVLASGSPRRRALLTQAGVAPSDVRPPAVDETPLPAEPAGALVRRLSRAKAAAVSRADDEVVLAADTVVSLDGRILGKPADDAEAVAMIRAWQGRVVTVWSGVTIVGSPEPGSAARTSSSVVTASLLRMRSLGAADIASYVATGEPRGVAGSFRIQGAGAALVAARAGCWTNVVGLPLCETARLLAPHALHLTPDGCAPGVTPPAPAGGV